VENEQIKQLHQEYNELRNMPDGLSWDNYDDWTNADHASYDERRSLASYKADELREKIFEVGGQSYALQQAEIAAEFWCGFLVDDKPPAHNVGNRMDSADNVLQQAFAEYAITVLHKMHTTEQVDNFRQSLISLIQKERNNTLQYLPIGVDYHPDRILQEACNAAGIEIAFCPTFPSKTMCYIDAISVSVSVGYRGEHRALMTCID